MFDDRTGVESLAAPPYDETVLAANRTKRMGGIAAVRGATRKTPRVLMMSIAMTVDQ
jgi:hypothetical protein